MQDHRLCFAGWIYADEKAGLTAGEYRDCSDQSFALLPACYVSHLN
jgi:hypothetical protein